jgi:hypothetical protein
MLTAGGGRWQPVQGTRHPIWVRRPAAVSLLMNTICPSLPTFTPLRGRGPKDPANQRAMAAFTLAAASPAALEPLSRPHRQEQAAGWLAPSPQRQFLGREQHGVNLYARSVDLQGPRSWGEGATFT